MPNTVVLAVPGYGSDPGQDPGGERLRGAPVSGSHGCRGVSVGGHVVGGSQDIVSHPDHGTS